VADPLEGVSSAGLIVTGADWLIMAAAVADFAPAAAGQKIKKDQIGQVWRLELSRTVDILGEVVPARRQPGLRVVGFALETEDLLAGAAAKLEAKGLDFVVANDPTADKERLLKAGARLVEEMHTDAGDHLVMIRDPWGHALQLCKRKEPMLSGS